MYQNEHFNKENVFINLETKLLSTSHVPIEKPFFKPFKVSEKEK